MVPGAQLSPGLRGCWSCLAGVWWVPFVYSCIFMFLPLLAGSLHVGDEIIEINGQSVSNHSVDQLQKMLVGICVWRGCSPGASPLPTDVLLGELVFVS